MFQATSCKDMSIWDKCEKWDKGTVWVVFECVWLWADVRVDPENDFFSFFSLSFVFFNVSMHLITQCEYFRQQDGFEMWSRCILRFLCLLCLWNIYFPAVKRKSVFFFSFFALSHFCLSNNRTIILCHHLTRRDPAETLHKGSKNNQLLLFLANIVQTGMSEAFGGDCGFSQCL